MPQLKFLNSKEVKEILKLIENQWGAELKLNYHILKNNKNRIFLINKDINKIELDKLRINSIGMYFCDLENGIRLSIEGSQIIGPKATNNVAEIDEEQVKQWLKGEDLELREGSSSRTSNISPLPSPRSRQDYSGFVVIKHDNDFLGTGKYKEGKILNYVSKSRRINASP